MGQPPRLADVRRTAKADGPSHRYHLIDQPFDRRQHLHCKRRGGHGLDLIVVVPNKLLDIKGSRLLLGTDRADGDIHERLACRQALDVLGRKRHSSLVDCAVDQILDLPQPIDPVVVPRMCRVRSVAVVHNRVHDLDLTVPTQRQAVISTPRRQPHR